MRPIRRIAFYAPMKAPDHPVPSGDRTVARLYMQALQSLGTEVEIISRLRIYDDVGDAAAQAQTFLEANTEIERISALWPSDPAASPDAWFTYHLYHKAPDLIGPELCRRFGLAYIVAEPSFAPKRAQGRWAMFHDKAGAAIAAADLALLATERDGECVLPLRNGRPTALIHPFADMAALPAPAPAAGGNRLIAVAMMRAGDKLASYRLLAEALAEVSEPWTLTIAGDGPEAGSIRDLFARFGNSVHFAGQVARNDVPAVLAAHDVFVWPAVNEAYGMAILEAQAMGLPVVAGDEGGVREVVRAGITAALTAPRDASAFAQGISDVLRDGAGRSAMALAAAEFARNERSLEAAARRIAEGMAQAGLSP